MKYLISMFILSSLLANCRHNSDKKNSEEVTAQAIDIDKELKTVWWKDHEKASSIVQRLKDLNRIEDADLADSKLNVEKQRSFKISELKSRSNDNACLKTHESEMNGINGGYDSATATFDSCLLLSATQLGNIDCFNNFHTSVTGYIKAFSIIAGCQN